MSVRRIFFSATLIFNLFPGNLLAQTEQSFTFSSFFPTILFKELLYDYTYDPYVFTGAYFKSKITRRQYSPMEVYAVSGLTWSLTGVGYGSFGPGLNGQYFLDNNITNASCVVMQHSFSIPIGFEFRFYRAPASEPGVSFAYFKILFDNGYLISSHLKHYVKESTVFGSVEFRDTRNLASFVRRYVPGLFVEISASLDIFTFPTFIHLGFAYQQISYNRAISKTMLDDRIESPFFAFFAPTGLFSQKYVYVGFEIPFKIF